MRPNGPTFWLLDGRTGWRTGQSENVSVGIEAGIHLAASPTGPLALTSTDGSIGGLRLPRGVSVSSDGTVYLLGVAQPRIKKFDPETQSFEELPEVGGPGTQARQFNQPANIAAVGGNLYVADQGNRRLQVFDVESLVLRHLWGPQDGSGSPVPSEDVRDWEPADVAPHDGYVYILDRSHGRVYRHRPGTDALELMVDDPAAAGRWTGLALDREGRIYLLDAATPRLEIYDPQGNKIGESTEAGDVRDRFDAPPIRQDHLGRFCLPESLTRLCDRRPPDAPPPPEVPLVRCQPASGGGLVFNREGNPVRVSPDEPLGPRPYTTRGVWLSEALDSNIYQCRWHRIQARFGDLPPGSKVTISTYTDESFRSSSEVYGFPEHLWDTGGVITGRLQAPPAASEIASEDRDFLVQSREGRYLWVRVQVEGDGYATPYLTSLKAHYPRESYLSFLPAVYSEDDDSRWFLERYLSIIQTEWDRIEREIEESARYFDPDAVPAGDFLQYLARWLALPLEDSWTWEQKRNLLSAVPEIHPRNGTVEGLRDYLRVYLQNITGISPEQQSEYPQIVEGFRERQRLMVSVPDGATLGQGAPLWSLSVVGRLQLDVFAREGEVRMVSTGDPERDLFHEYAHRFRVFVPASWIRTAEEERMVRRAIDSEKPGHTQYDLCLVEPRLRVGMQSTVGIDTIIGDYPVAHLACVHRCGSGDCGEEPPSRQPRHILGYDTILAGEPTDAPVLQLRPGKRMGMETILT